MDKLKSYEPLFGSWYVDTKLSEGKNSKFYKVYKTDGVQTDYMGLKTVRFPSGEQELSRVIASGTYNNVDEYLDALEQNVTKNMDIMRSLSFHQNIVSLQNYTIVREASCFYVLMLTEILSPLNEYLSFETVTKTDAVKLGCDICKAMAAFRERGIVHHNITPENIYVDSKGDYKLGTFGLYDFSGNISEGSLYMAPELYQKTMQVDTSSDIYALGMLIYKLLNNNRLPFLPAYPAPISLSDREQSFARCMRGEKFPTPANADFKLSTIISKATAFRADERYISPLAMLAQLETYSPYTPATPIVTEPYTGFEIKQDEGIHFDSYQEPQEETIEEYYQESFDDYEEEQPKKRWYFLVLGLLIVLALVVALILKSGSDGKDKTTTRPYTSTTLAPPTQPTTEESTTEETTTEESTEESTTEETTTETTTEETTTETTTEETTEEESEEATEPYTEPTLVSTNRKNGDKSPDGKTYMKISSYTLEQTPEDEFFDEVLLTIGDNLGENLFGTKAYIYQMSDSSLIQKVNANIDCEISEEFGGNILCTITVEDSDFYYEPEYFQYFLCFEEGALISDTVITLPLQIRIESEY